VRLLGELLFEAGMAKPENLTEVYVYELPMVGEIVREQLYARTLRRHHALDDARALCAGWKATRRGSRG
jgi:hypothetical protein